MKKMDDFSHCLDILNGADFALADNDEIYRTGIIWQFIKTFNLAWKALQELLIMHGVTEAETGTPLEILKLGYRMGFISDYEVWHLILGKVNDSVHLCNKDESDELIRLIRERFIPVFTELEKMLNDKMSEVKGLK